MSEQRNCTCTHDRSFHKRSNVRGQSRYGECKICSCSAYTHKKDPKRSQFEEPEVVNAQSFCEHIRELRIYIGDPTKYPRRWCCAACNSDMQQMYVHGPIEEVNPVVKIPPPNRTPPAKIEGSEV